MQSQESKYNAKVDEVKAQHEELLKEAFERAKVISQSQTFVFLKLTFILERSRFGARARSSGPSRRVAIYYGATSKCSPVYH